MLGRVLLPVSKYPLVVEYDVPGRMVPVQEVSGRECLEDAIFENFSSDGLKFQGADDEAKHLVSDTTYLNLLPTTLAD